jgi:molybdenum cofactor biosynthesis enzyme MoaA
MPSPVDDQNTTVIDVTYRCNATCRYCQWGDKSNPRSIHRPLAEILLPTETIRALGTQRIVLSGGEPRIHPQLESVLKYYSGMVDDVVLITNGYGLDEAELRRLLDNGATGITVSLDSLDAEVAFATRNTPPSLHAQVVSSLKLMSDRRHGFELGINSVVSHPTANVKNVRDILEFGHSLGIDFVKFQPIFDDGYVSQNAPALLLNESNGQDLLRIAEALPHIDSPETNAPSFWRELAVLVNGGSLDPKLCGLGRRHAISTSGKLNICYWLDSASFGDVSSLVLPEQAQIVRSKFEREKLACKVGNHCFCTQNLSHEWRVVDS